MLLRKRRGQLLIALKLIWRVHPVKCWLDESQVTIKIAGRNINGLRYADDTTLMAESKEELKSLLMRVKEESEKADLKLNIQKTKIMAQTHLERTWAPVGQWKHLQIRL